MSHTLTIRISSELAKWLEETAARTGISQGQLIREQIEKVKAESSNRAFMQLAGSISGPNTGGMICDL
jgi:predicted DNA-binding protein